MPGAQISLYVSTNILMDSLRETEFSAAGEGTHGRVNYPS